ncbi:MAG: TonB-dependent receptor [Novosphingobium sp.]
MLKAPSSAIAATLSVFALAAAPARAAEDQDHHRGSHVPDKDAEIVVVGHPPVDFSLLNSTASLEGDDLTARLSGQVGDILSRLPGVSATSFAPGVSRPVLRGFDGDRIRVLTDGIGSIDASNVSADHAVVFDALTVDHIDIVHGPAVLLFGGQAIGGAVNAIDTRIPRSVPDAVKVTAIGSYGTAARERALSGAIQVPLADRLVVHADANWRKSNDLRVGGFVNSASLRSDLLSDAAEHRLAGENDEAAELEELAGQRGRVPNSATRNYTLGASIAFIDAGGHLGISVQHHDSRYGVPMRPGAGHGHDEHDDGPHADEAHGAEEHGDAPVTIGLVQTRIDLRGAVEMTGVFDSLQVRGAFGDYRHIEYEGAEEGTRFAGKGFEFRADLVQANQNGWRGRSGIQLQGRKLTIVEPEAFTPDNDVTRLGFFTLQSLELGGGFQAEVAGRYENARIKASSVGFSRSFDLWSAAAGLSWKNDSGLKLGANYIRGARAPAPEELLSDGMHVATQSYERGNPAFGTETSDGFELYARYETDAASLAVTGYASRFDRFIAALPTGEEEDGLPVFQYVQLPARFHGFEAEGSVNVARWSGGLLRLNAAADYTRARLKGVGPVPRIPPLRLRGGAQVEMGALHLHGEVEWNAAQKRVAAFENAVKGFTLVNLSADWHPMGEDGPLTLLLAADNIFDVVGRRAASFTRDFVPLAGRDIRLTAKISF